MYRVAHNRALTHVARRHAEEAELEEGEEMADARPGPEEEVTRGMERAELRERVAALPLGLRQVTMLVLEGLTHGEIGAVLGISAGNVAVRLARAKRQLQGEGVRR